MTQNVIRGLDRSPCIADLERILADDSDTKIDILPDGQIRVAEKLTGLARQVAELENESHELGNIRATLLLNFGDTTHNKYGFKIKDDGSTINLLIEVLEKLTEPKEKP